MKDTLEREVSISRAEDVLLSFYERDVAFYLASSWEDACESAKKSMQSLKAYFYYRSGISKVGCVVTRRECRAKNGFAHVSVSESFVLQPHDFNVGGALSCGLVAFSVRPDDAAKTGSRKSEQQWGSLGGIG